MIAVTLCGEAPTFETPKVVEQVRVGCQQRGRLLDGPSFGVALTQLALIEALFGDSWMRAHLWPRHKRIHIAACRLLVDKIKIAPELF
mgnify:CR=1 FL=1